VITAFIATPTNPVFSVGGTFAVSATGGASGQPVVFASTTPGICTVAGSSVTMVSAGSCALTADQAGNSNYSAAPQETLSVTIGAATQVITFAAQSGQSFVSGSSFALNPLATVSSGLAVTYSSQSPAVCSINGSTVTMLSAGNCVIAADQAGDNNYAAAKQETQIISIGRAAQSIRNFVANPAEPVYAAGGSFALDAEAGASAEPLLFASSTPSTCTVNGSTVTMVAAGTCSLTADQAGNANYSAAVQAKLDVVIGKAAPVLSWLGDLHKQREDGNFDLPDPSSNASGAFHFSSSDTRVARIDGRTVTLLAAGTVTLTATQAATANFVEGMVSLQLTVNDRPDPTRDPGVIAGVQAQVDASLRFVQAQQDNIRSRLSQLRHGGNASSQAMSLNLQGGMGQQGLALNAGQVGAPAPKLPAGWGFWSAGAIQWGQRDARSNAEGSSFRTDGISVGVDRRFGESTTLGFAGGYGWNDTDFDTVGSALDSRQKSLALYGNWHSRAWFIDGLLGWGQLDFDIRRRSNEVNASAVASREGQQGYASLSLGYDHQGETGTLTGYGRLDASRTALQAYREHGLGDYDLQYRRQILDSSTAALGVEGRYLFRTARASVRPSWMLEWRQALRSNGDAALNYVVAPNDSDYLLGVRSYNDNTLAFGGGVEFGFRSGWTMALQFRREQASDLFANSFGLRLSYGQQAPVLDAEQLWWRESGLTRPQLEATPAQGR
ncbi:autotransporter domain-containing protein, partial [Stenotrophomonas sp.]|uniref:autotransporter domain-containing protein n=1 Tax=Stenotrophomonas sp. TaxID=69392 RepID=UPI0028A2A4C5